MLSAATGQVAERVVFSQTAQGDDKTLMAKEGCGRESRFMGLSRGGEKHGQHRAVAERNKRGGWRGRRHALMFTMVPLYLQRCVNLSAQAEQIELDDSQE